MTATSVQSLAELGQTFSGLLDLAGRVVARTLTEYRRDLHHYTTFCAANGSNPHDAQSLRAWRTQMADHTGLSPNTINRRLYVVKRVVRATALLGDLPIETAHAFSLIEPVQVAPLRHRLRPDARVKIGPPGIRALIDAPDTKTLLGLRDRALLATLAGSGCRIGEMMRLQRGHILRVSGGLMIEILGKGQEKPRLAPLSLEAHGAIEAWLEARRRYVDVQHVFTGFKGPGAKGLPTARPLSTWSGWSVVTKYAKQIGLEFKPHDVRRFVGTRLAAKDLRKAQLALGHKRLETTARHYVLDELEAGLTDGLY